MSLLVLLPTVVREYNLSLYPDSVVPSVLPFQDLPTVCSGVWSSVYLSFLPPPHPTPHPCVCPPHAVTCPNLNDVVTTCDVGCGSDDACEGSQICCPGGCSSLCVDPVRLTCPDVSGVAGVCVESCRNSSQCGSGQLCCSNGCGHVCVIGDELNCSVSTQQWLQREQSK